MEFRNVLAMGVVVFAATAPVSGALVTFDGGTELATEFNNPVSPGTKIFVQEALGGLGAGPGSGSLRVSGAPSTGSDDNEATYKSGFSFGQGDTFETSILIHKTANGVGTGLTRAFQLGFTTNSTNPMPFTNSTVFPNSFISTRINYAGIGSGNYQLELQQRISESGSVLNTIVAGSGTNAPSALPNSWLLFTVSVGYSDATTGAFAVSASVRDYGADGLTPGATVLSFGPTTVTNGSLTGPRTIYGGLRSIGNALGDGTRFDNYSVGVQVVPEPAALGLVALSTIGLVSRRRRV